MAYTLSDYFTVVVRHFVEPAAKEVLMPGVFALLDACDAFALKDAHAALSQTGKEEFKAVYERYGREHRYTGEY